LTCKGLPVAKRYRQSYRGYPLRTAEITMTTP